MKILVISARYPPYHFGGYELRCKNIMDALSSRGHEILVLTSQKEAYSQVSQSEAEYPIYRRLHLSRIGSFIDRMTLRRWSYPLGILLVFIRELCFDLRDTAFVDRQIEQFRPDVIYLGHITNLSRAFMPYLAACNIPIVYDEGGSGLIDAWMERGIWYKFIERFPDTTMFVKGVAFLVIKTVRILSRNRLKLQWNWPDEMRVVFNSELSRRKAMAQGVPSRETRVIHSGVDTEKFRFHGRRKIKSPLVLIAPGRIEPRKGQLDAVKLLAKLTERGIDARMILVGRKLVDSYYRQIVAEIDLFGLHDRIEIQPMVAHERLVAMYHEADLCFFPSYQKTGYSRIPLEAMACGCIVISYGNEGSDEIIEDNRNGFVVSSVDLQSVTEVIRKLILRPEMVKEITEVARNEIEANCSMKKYVDSIEQLIMSTATAL